MIYNEVDSKRLIMDIGIEISQPILCVDESDVLKVRSKLPDHLAVKVVSPDITHKAVIGGVLLNVNPEGAVAAFHEVIENGRRANPDARIDGVLFEEMVPQGPELFIGGRVDLEYGPIVMVGLGGGKVERLQPLTALGPISNDEARCLAIAALEQVEVGANKEDYAVRLQQYLLAVGGEDGLLCSKAIRDVDINPVIVSNGRLIAADAVVICYDDEHGGPPKTNADIRNHIGIREHEAERLSALFTPKSIAFIGASANPDKLGNRHVRNIQEFGFRGPIYPVHPRESEILGLNAYRTITDVPSRVDLAYVAVAAEHVPKEIGAAVKAKVKMVQVLTAGFSEWHGKDCKDGISLEREISDLLQDGSTRMVGPNCMGTFSSERRLTLVAPRYSRAGTGSIAFVSQSGTFAADVVRRCCALDVAVGKVVSCGNCLDLKLVDYLMYLEQDPATKLIGVYAEAIDEPWLFFRYIRSMKTPVVMLKGGVTEEGVKAAQSHTAALATRDRLWSIAAPASGIVQVPTLEALIDVFNVFSTQGTVDGQKIAIFGSGGGVSVTCTDYATEAGFELAALSERSKKALESFGVPGTSVANPVDIPVWGLIRDGRHMTGPVLDALARDPNVDVLVAYVEVGTFMDFADGLETGLRQIDGLIDSVPDLSGSRASVALIFRKTASTEEDTYINRVTRALKDKGVCVFDSEVSAIRAYGYSKQLNGRVAG